MNYWIIVDSKPAGPYEGSELVKAGLKADTLVWRQGYADWVEAARVPELEEMMRMRDLAPMPEPAPEAPAEPVTPAEATAEVEAEVEEVFIETPAPEDAAEPEPEVSRWEPAAMEDQPQRETPATPQPTPQAERNMIDANAEIEPCPPAYVAWSVIVTLLCCTIVGVAALIYSSMTKSAYYRGDLAKSKKYSEITQWLIIASIVCGTALAPFQTILMGMLH